VDGRVRGLVEVLPQNLPGGTKKDLESISSNSRCLGLVSNGSPSEYKTRVSHLYQSARFMTTVCNNKYDCNFGHFII
jgi:hypothetical protein